MIKQFLALRYSLVEHNQQALMVKPLPKPKGDAVRVSVDGDREFSANGVRYSFVGFDFIEPTSGEFPEGRFLVGKMAKYRQAHLGAKIPGDIQEFDVDNWIPIIVVIDIVGQYIFVQKDYKFGTGEQICNALQDGLRYPVLEVYNHLVFVEPKLEAGTFWSIVENHKRLYKMEINLISPNILETNIKAREALEGLKALFGQDDVTIKFKSENGDLKVPENPVSAYVDYIEEGEGKWSLTTEGDHGGKKTYNSRDSAMIFEIEAPDVEGEVEDDNQLRIDSEVVPGKHSSEAIMVAGIYSAIGSITRR
jgi:hypothetical protein